MSPQEANIAGKIDIISVAVLQSLEGYKRQMKTQKDRALDGLQVRTVFDDEILPSNTSASEML